MKKRLLIINQAQFGYHMCSVQYCIFLRDEFEITYLCWDYKRKRIDETGVEIILVPRKGNIIIRNIKFIYFVITYLLKEKFDFVYIDYFRGSSLISLLNINKQSLHLDFRTGSISKSKSTRFINDFMRRMESKFFLSQSVISAGLRKKLQIRQDAYILPLGANPLILKRECTHFLYLLYIGVFNHRRMEDTIDGFKLFLTKNPKADIHYTLVGDGEQNEREILQKRIDQLGLRKYIDLTGYVPYNELLKFYELANVGVSYIPITSYFEFQPPTKTFEYLMAGMPVIATRTYENMQIVNQLNGVLIKDTPESFAKGIEHIYNLYSNFDENAIRKSVESYEWSKIVQNMKKAILS